MGARNAAEGRRGNRPSDNSGVAALAVYSRSFIRARRTFTLTFDCRAYRKRSAPSINGDKRVLVAGDVFLVASRCASTHRARGRVAAIPTAIGARAIRGGTVPRYRQSADAADDPRVRPHRRVDAALGCSIGRRKMLMSLAFVARRTSESGRVRLPRSQARRRCARSPAGGNRARRSAVYRRRRA